MRSSAFKAFEIEGLSDAESWDACVSSLLGPRMAEEPDDQRQQCALELAAAALRFAGEHVLAQNLLD